MDKRIKGEPTSLNFKKDLMESLDEAEKLKIYKVGYLSFGFTRVLTLALLVLSLLLRTQKVLVLVT